MSGSISELKIAEAEGWIRVSIMLACSVAQSRLILCDPMDYSPPHSSVHGVFQSRILEWDAISSSRGPSQPRDCTCESFFKFYFIFKLYNIVLVLPNIEMNPPQVYPCSPS